MTTFLTVKEASQITGKSPSSIRRVIYPIIHNDAHPDRPHVQPTIEDVMALRMKGENFAWKLSEELLRRELPPETKHEHAPDSPRGKSAPDVQAELLLVLRRELDIKNEQITQQGKVIGAQIDLISGLSERLREGNILIGTLQQRLSLTDGRPKTPTEDAKPKPMNATPPKSDVKPKPANPAPAKKGSATPPKPAKPKPGFFARFFQ